MRKKMDSVILKDGTVAGFLVSQIKNHPIIMEFNDKVRGELVHANHTKIVVSLVLDAGTIKQSDYLKGPDPSKPLTFDLHTLLRVPPAINGVPQKSVPLDKDPSDDFVVRARFIKYADMTRLLKLAGYQKKAKNNYPLPGHIYMPVTLGGANGTTNYPTFKDGFVYFGGEEIVESIAQERAALSEILDDIVDGDVGSVTESSPIDYDDEDEITGYIGNKFEPENQGPTDEEKQIEREEAKTTGKKTKK